jgi:P27 family predicted phage terminase small subunit
MGRRGPPPEPTALKLLKGNPGKRAINHDEPRLPPALMTPPKGLNGRALTVWKELAPLVIAAGILKAGEWPVLRTYCELIQDVEHYTRLCRRVGAESASKLGYPKRLDVYRKQLREYSGILGLNPSARSALKVAPPPAAGDASADFLFGKPKEKGA